MEKITVLVVEDSTLILMDLETALHDGGFETISAFSGEDAISLLEKNPEIRALVTDINLKAEVTGWDVARRGRELQPTLPVLYVSSVASSEWAAQGVPKSILLGKPFAAAQILTAVAQLLNEVDDSSTNPERKF